jgi:hypothetical protein
MTTLLVLRTSLDRLSGNEFEARAAGVGNLGREDEKAISDGDARGDEKAPREVLNPGGFVDPRVGGAMRAAVTVDLPVRVAN